MKNCLTTLLLLILSISTAFSQVDSISIVTISEYKSDTIFWQDQIQRNYAQNKLIFEYKQYGLGREDIDFEMTTYFYDFEGALEKSVHIEEDRYNCPPKFDPNWNGFTIPLSVSPYFPVEGVHVVPDSIETVPQFCGSYSTRTTRYSPYVEVSEGHFFWDDGDTTYFVDSLFYDRYHELIGKLTYVDDELKLEYRYFFKRDNQGRIIQKRWDNRTPGKEFKIVQDYIFDGDRQLQVSYTHESLHDAYNVSGSKTYYDDSFNLLRHENYEGDSLTSAYNYVVSEGDHKSLGINDFGDTLDVSHFKRKENINKLESWSFQSIRSDKYLYGIVDTITKGNGYSVRTKRYRITKEQFEKCSRKMKTKNRLLHKSTEKYDQFGRLIREEEFDDQLGKTVKTYDYQTAYRKN